MEQEITENNVCVASNEPKNIPPENFGCNSVFGYLTRIKKHLIETSLKIFA